jgi:16S rRNA (uracil1498-N3)-methyltransferase
MRKVRIYEPGSYEVCDSIELSTEAGQHVGVVLRMRAGEIITLFRGDNREFEAVLLSVHKKRVSVRIAKVYTVNKESVRKIHLVQAVSKGERMEMVVQKAVELGVCSIIPVITEHCSVKLDKDRSQKKQQHWQSIAIGACEQSGRNSIPIIHPIMHLEEYLQQTNDHKKLLLTPDTINNWRKLEVGLDEISLHIGPEGGWSNLELSRFQECHFIPLSLGPRILRTETAAITGLAILQAVYGDL